MLIGQTIFVHLFLSFTWLLSIYCESCPSVMAQPALNVETISIPFVSRQPIFRGIGTLGLMNVASVQNALTTTVWSSNWNPPLQGEPPVPFALQIDAQNQLNQLFNIEVSCDFVFPPNWRNPQNGAGFFKIHLTNQNHISLLSEVHPVPAPNPALPKPNSFSVQGFKLQPLVNGNILGPFKSGIDWTISILSCNAVGSPVPNQTVDHAPAVPLEAYFFVGPLHDVFSQSFPYAHRLEIIRNSVMDLATYVQTHSTIEYKQAAAKYIAQNIWTILPTHLAYDNIAGKASCGFLSHGGILEMTVVFGAANDTFNCYDLAGINQAWCAALGMADNQAPPNGTAVLETCHARVDLANLANVTLCQADIDRDDWIAVAVNTGHDTAANVGKWKPIATDYYGNAEETTAPGVTNTYVALLSESGLQGIIG